MTYFYSATTGGFYTDAIHAEIPDDAVAITDDAYQGLLNDQSAGQEITADAQGQPAATAAPAPTRADLLTLGSRAVQAILDAKVQERDYDSIESACSYASSTVGVWQGEAVALAAWRDQVWQWFYATTQGTLPSRAELVKNFPPFTWPT